MSLQHIAATNRPNSLHLYRNILQNSFCLRQNLVAATLKSHKIKSVRMLFTLRFLEATKFCRGDNDVSRRVTTRWCCNLPLTPYTRSGCFAQRRFAATVAQQVPTFRMLQNPKSFFFKIKHTVEALRVSRNNYLMTIDNLQSKKQENKHIFASYFLSYLLCFLE